MSNTVIDHLEREWVLIAASRSSVRRLRDWGDPVLNRFAGLQEIVEGVRSADPNEANVILGALVKRAATDQLAARMALQVLLPGVKAIASTYRHLDSQDDIASTVVTAAMERIRTYPYERRPERIAANILLDTRHVLYETANAHNRLAKVIGPVTPLSELRGERSLLESRSSTQEVVDIVKHAVSSGAIDRRDAALIVGHRVFDVPLSEFPHLQGLADDTRRKHRLRVERNLARSVELG